MLKNILDILYLYKGRALVVIGTLIGFCLIASVDFKAAVYITFGLIAIFTIMCGVYYLEDDGKKK